MLHLKLDNTKCCSKQKIMQDINHLQEKYLMESQPKHL